MFESQFLSLRLKQWFNREFHTVTGLSDWLFLQVFHECFLNPCQNKGTCEEVGAGYVCTCMPGFTGKPLFRQRQKDDHLRELTAISPTAVLGVTLLWRVFNRASDISGAKCEVDIDECDSTPCQNGGLCRDGMGEFDCQCKPGFLGKGPLRVKQSLVHYNTFYAAINCKAPLFDITWFILNQICILASISICQINAISSNY